MKRFSNTRMAAARVLTVIWLERPSTKEVSRLFERFPRFRSNGAGGMLGKVLPFARCGRCWGGSIVERLPEFRVTLTRLRPGEPAYPETNEDNYDEVQGCRTKLGGVPDWIQHEGPNPKCPLCHEEMTFIAQIDSIEHESAANPHSVDALSDRRRWMFCDVGMIFVFYCFSCLQSHAELDC